MKETLLRKHVLDLQEELYILENKFFHARMALQKNCLHDRVIAFDCNHMFREEPPCYIVKCLLCGKSEEDKSELKVFHGNPILWVKDYGDPLYKYVDREDHEYSDFLTLEEIEKLGKFAIYGESDNSE